MIIHTPKTKIILLWSALVWNLFWSFLINLTLVTQPDMIRETNGCLMGAIVVIGWSFTFLPLCWGLFMSTQRISNWHYLSVGLLVPLGLLEGFFAMFALAFSCDGGKSWNFG